jgi:hypothetical protein
MTTHDAPDPDELDPDADPGMLNPRTGGQASDDGTDDDDTDADPDNLNPRDPRDQRPEARG